MTDRGAADTLGLVLIAPVAIAVALLVLWVGRQSDTSAQVRAASSAAAQAAARQRNPSMGFAAAQATVRASLTDGTACSGGPRVTVEATSWRPGSAVAVSVTCTPATHDLGGLAPDGRVVTARATAVIDPYRAGALP